MLCTSSVCVRQSCVYCVHCLRACYVCACVSICMLCVRPSIMRLCVMLCVLSELSCLGGEDEVVAVPGEVRVGLLHHREHHIYQTYTTPQYQKVTLASLHYTGHCHISLRSRPLPSPTMPPLPPLLLCLPTCGDDALPLVPLTRVGDLGALLPPGLDADAQHLAARLQLPLRRVPLPTTQHAYI